MSETKLDLPELGSEKFKTFHMSVLNFFRLNDGPNAKCRGIFVSSILSLIIFCGATQQAGATQTRPATPSFSTDWKSGLVGRGLYSQVQVVDSDRLVATDTCPERQDFGCIKVTVKAGDFLYSGERSEVSQMSDKDGKPIVENSSSGTKYYALSVYVPASWQAPSSSRKNGIDNGRWGTIFQLHGPDALKASPAFALMVEDEFAINLRGGDLAINKKNEKYFLKNRTIPKNKWVDFVIGIRFSSDGDGAITVWRHDQGAPTFIKELDLANISTLQYIDGNVGDHYWKTGLYRSQSLHTSELYLGPQARGQSPAAAAATAFKNVKELARINWDVLFDW